MEKKYMLTDDTTTMSNGRKFYRIVALKDFGLIKAGTLGGYIEKEDNLSHEGEAWVYKNARVGNNARIYDDAKVDGNACVYGNAKIHGNAYVFGDACVYGNAEIYDHAHVYDNAHIHGNATVLGKACISNKVNVHEHATIMGAAEIHGCAQIYGNCTIGGESYVAGNVHVYGNAEVFEKCIIFGNTKVFGCTRLVNAWIESNDDFITIQSSSDGSPITFFRKDCRKGAEHWNFTFKQLVGSVQNFDDIITVLFHKNVITCNDHKLLTAFKNHVVANLADFAFQPNE